MKISIDEDVVAKLQTLDGRQLNIGELLVCLLVKLDYNIYEVIDELLNKGVLLRDTNIPDKLMIFMKYSKLVESILLQSDKSVPKQEELEELVTTLQEFFPKERKCDSAGIPKWSYRGNKRDITNRLQKFYKLYGNQWSKEQIIQATQNYVNRFTNDKSYMKILQYFIYKDGEGSQLANELEGLDIDDSVILDTNWTANLSTNG